LLKQADSLPLAVIRGTVPQSDLARVVPEWCGLVWSALRGQQAQAGRHVAVYWDAAIRLEVGVELLGPFVEQDNVVCSTTPSGLVASVAHLGPYSHLGSAYDAIRDWCVGNGYRLAGPSWEIYDHWQREWDTDSSRIRTDIFYLVTREPWIR
jgi:effector-binding domain-containing protein